MMQSWRNGVRSVIEKSPTEVGEFEFPAQRSKRIRMMSGIGIPTSQRRMGI